MALHPFICPFLKSLKLSSGALQYIDPHIKSLPCQYLSVDICYSDNWQDLYALFTRGQNMFPSLSRVTIRWLPYDDQGAEDSTIFVQLQGLLRQREVTTTVNMDWDGRASITAEELFIWLPCMAEELVAFGLLLHPTSSADSPGIRFEERLHLPRLRSMTIRIDENLKRSSAALYHILAELPRQVCVPTVTPLVLDIRTTYSDYLSIMGAAVKGKTWPKLCAIIGQYRMESKPSGWRETVVEFRAREFRHTCASAGIALTDLALI